MNGRTEGNGGDYRVDLDGRAILGWARSGVSSRAEAAVLSVRDIRVVESPSARLCSSKSWSRGAKGRLTSLRWEGNERKDTFSCKEAALGLCDHLTLSSDVSIDIRKVLVECVSVFILGTLR